MSVRRNAVQQGLSSLVLLKVKHHNGRSGGGSGCVLDKSKGLILTNKHVAETKAKSVLVFTKQGKSKAKVIYNHPKLDISVVKVNKPSILRKTKNIEFSSNYMIGDIAYVVGHPMEFDYVVTFGIISKKFKERILIDIDVNFGNSGGLLINEFGDFIGLVYATHFGDLGNNFLHDYYRTGFGFAIKGDVILKILKKEGLH